MYDTIVSIIGKLQFVKHYFGIFQNNFYRWCFAVLSTVEKIQDLMKNSGINAKQLTAELGLSSSSITDWKKGKGKPSAETIIKIASYFDVSADYLLGIKRNRPPEGERSVDPTVAGIIEVVQDMTEDEVAKVQEYAQLLKLKRTQLP
jgi:transcriptional regulator with XRE-family HTH domain